ncbi:MAG: type II toxin-antitoxin system PemK/MazF family toxin [Candidatus Aenigmarchaeota archaeon]|nr:type II toxin-antitoxin system PemK/MazF family toxin [Candidatus Aenigmarchaeota archaeon]
MEKGEIWVVGLPDAADHEQLGARPAVILADTSTSVCAVVSMTTYGS